MSMIQSKTEPADKAPNRVAASDGTTMSINDLPPRDPKPWAVRLKSAFVAGIAIHGIFWIYATMMTASAYAQPWSSVGGPVGIALYSAVCAPPVHALLMRLLRWLGLDAPRYSHARLRRIGARSIVV